MDYVNNLVYSVKDEGNKTLWRYLKFQKQDNPEGAPLSSDCSLVRDAACKVDVLSTQFASFVHTIILCVSYFVFMRACMSQCGGGI